MSFRLENPHMLLAFLPLLLLLGLQLYHWQTHRQGFGWRRCFFTFLGFSCGILALARVQAGSYELRKSHGEGDLYLAIDVSKSMLAEDILPLAYNLSLPSGKLLQSIPKTRVAIFPFAADGFLLMPLTSDHLAAVDMLKGLSPDSDNRSRHGYERRDGHSLYADPATPAQCGESLPSPGNSSQRWREPP
jgi:hypothetical protein